MRIAEKEILTKLKEMLEYIGFEVYVNSSQHHLFFTREDMEHQGRILLCCRCPSTFKYTTNKPTANHLLKPAPKWAKEKPLLPFSGEFNLPKGYNPSPAEMRGGANHFLRNAVSDLFLYYVRKERGNGNANIYTPLAMGFAKIMDSRFTNAQQSMKTMDEAFEDFKHGIALTVLVPIFIQMDILQDATYQPYIPKESIVFPHYITFD